MSEDLKKVLPPSSQKLSLWFSSLRVQALRVWPFATGVLAALIGVLIYTSLYPAPRPRTQAEIEESIVMVMASATPAPAYSAQVYQLILPSLVIIQARDEASKAEAGVGIGTGVVVSNESDILTAFHVVAEATEIETIFADGTRASAEIVVAEPENDIAVLRPGQPPDVIVPAVLGNPNAMRIGDEAFAVGNPLGLAGSMSAGVISGFNRSLPLPDSDARLEGLIQFDAAVNPGNSGGPLLNRNGQVIGIVTALVNPAEQDFFVGIGFAVPIPTAAGAAGLPSY